MSACASRRARAPASKFKNAQNHFLNKGEYEPGHFEHFKISRPYVSAHAQRALKVEIKNFHIIWIPDTTIDNFHSFAVTLDLS